MRWLKKLLLLRKQQDRVKLIVCFFTAGAIFMVRLLLFGSAFYQEQNTPAEYVLSEGETVNDGMIDRIRQWKTCKTACRQRTNTVTFQGGWGTIALEYVQIEADYLKEVYAVKETSGMQTFYLNQAAWDQIAGRMKESGMSLPENGKTQMTVTTGDPEQTQKVRLLLYPDLFSEEEPRIFCMETAAGLSDADEVRVVLSGHDTDHAAQKYFSELGFSFLEEKQIVEQNARDTLTWTQIRYEAVLAAVCFVSAICLNRYKEGKYEYCTGAEKHITEN